MGPTSTGAEPFGSGEATRIRDGLASWLTAGAPLPPDEPARLAALRDYQALDTPPEEGFDRITRLVERVLRVPIALVTLVDQDRQWFKSCVGLGDLQQTGRDVAFCAHTILRNEPMVVPDATQDPRFCENPLVTGWPHIRFYMGVPLRTPEGHNVGSLCAIDTVAREATDEMVETLRALAAVVVDELELRKALRESERQRALVVRGEEAYRHLAESIQGMVFHAVQRDVDRFDYEYVSLGSLELLGLFPEQVLARPNAVGRLLHADDRVDAYRAIAEAMRTGRPYLWEGRLLLERNETKWIRCLARGERRPDGTTHWRGVMVDVTEAHRQSELLEERVRERTRELEDAQVEILDRLARATELRDDDTGEHVSRVATTAGAIARSMGLGEDEACLLEKAVRLHDVGKIAVPDRVLLKAGPLEPEERAAMCEHAERGGRILEGSRFALLQCAEEIARHHHERWDGGGYPRGLSGEAIPLFARIAAVADVFDALTSERPYKAAWPPERAVAEIELGAGSQFDPTVVAAFLGAIGRGAIAFGHAAQVFRKAA